MQIEIYTDGGCEPNPGEGAWAFVVISNKIKLFKESGYCQKTTNNKMELSAILMALSYCVEHDIREPVIYSDSEYCIKSITLWYYSWLKKNKLKSKKNIDLISKCVELSEKINPTYSHVRAHSGNRWNEYADNMCSEMISNPNRVNGLIESKKKTFIDILESWLKKKDEYGSNELELVEDFAYYLDSHFDSEIKELL